MSMIRFLVNLYIVGINDIRNAAERISDMKQIQNALEL